MWQDYIEKYKDKKVKLIVAGSRDFKDEKLAFAWLDSLLRELTPSQVVILDGKAKGADAIGGNYGRSRGIDVWDFPADWKNLDVPICKVGTNQYGEYNKLAGLQRNEDMGNNATHLLAFNLGTSGTNAMIKYATKLGLRVKEVKLYE
tara:strand:+ start:925 stop:1365 length:441 start_codon:yes stop_codon:yes gene_type:complete